MPGSHQSSLLNVTEWVSQSVSDWQALPMIGLGSDKNLLRSQIKIWWNHYCNLFLDFIFRMDQLKPQCFKFTWIWQMLQQGCVRHLSGGHPSHPACPDQSWRWRQISTCLEDYLSFPPSPPVASDLFCAFRNEVQVHMIYSFCLNCSDQLDSIEVFGIQIRWSFAGGVLSLKHEGKCCDNFKAVF